MPFDPPPLDDPSLQALAAWGVDLSLIRATLALTPTERLERMVDFLAVGEALRQSYIRRIEQSATGDLDGHSEIGR